jgi:hypothetical protein
MKSIEEWGRHHFLVGLFWQSVQHPTLSSAACLGTLKDMLKAVSTVVILNLDQQLWDLNPIVSAIIFSLQYCLQH